MSKGAWAVTGIGVGAIAAGSAFAGTQYANRVDVQRMEPAAGTAVATARPLIAFTTPNASDLTKLKVTLDGKDVSDRVGRTDDGRLVIATPPLKDGAHKVDVTVATRNVFSRTVRRAWSFDVDTKAPKLAVAKPKRDAINTRSVAFAGTSEAGATVKIGWKAAKKNGTATATADDRGRWSATAKLPEGRSAVRTVVTDRAGNSTTAQRVMTVDTVAPRLRAAKLPPALTTDDPVISGEIRGDSPESATIGAEVNGKEVIPARVGSLGGGTPTLTVQGNTFQMSVGALPQGNNTVTVFVRDAAGNKAEVTSKVMVDSTEEFGSKDLMPGAKGADIKAFQEQLRERGYKKTKLTGVYDKQTQQMVARYQRRAELQPSGVFTKRTRENFIGRIVIDISQFKLRLIRDGKVVKTYKVAVGQPAYPTPTGNYVVVNKQADPTWTPPPDSDWAKGLGPIPPGPGNPLGTRWIGTSAPLVGIHGTYAPSSIGTRASHGCIRMHIKDVEELFEQVAVGMPVQMRA